MSTSWDSSGPQLKAIDGDGQTQTAFWYDDVNSNPNTMKQAFPSSNVWVYQDLDNLDYDFIGGAFASFPHPVLLHTSNAQVRNRLALEGYLDNNTYAIAFVGADGTDSTVLEITPSVAFVVSEVVGGDNSGGSSQIEVITELSNGNILVRCSGWNETQYEVGEPVFGSVDGVGVLVANFPLKQANGTGYAINFASGGYYGGNAGGHQLSYGSGLSAQVYTQIPTDAEPTGFNLYELVTGGTSGATGYIFEIGNISLSVYNVIGTFVDGEVVTGAGGGSTIIDGTPNVNSSPSNASVIYEYYGSGSPGTGSIMGGNSSKHFTQFGVPGVDNGAGRGSAGEELWRDNIGITVLGIVDVKADSASTTGDFVLQQNLRVLANTDTLISDADIIELGYKGNFAVSSDMTDLEGIVTDNWTAGSRITIQFATAGKVIKNNAENIYCPAGGDYITQINDEVCEFILDTNGYWHLITNY
jgi:hypothetical protein